MLIRYNFRELVFLQNYAEELRRTYVKLPHVISSIFSIVNYTVRIVNNVFD